MNKIVDGRGMNGANVCGRLIRTLHLYPQSGPRALLRSAEPYHSGIASVRLRVSVPCDVCVCASSILSFPRQLFLLILADWKSSSGTAADGSSRIEVDVESRDNKLSPAVWGKARARMETRAKKKTMKTAEKRL